MNDLYGLPGQTYQAFDVVLAIVLGILEYHDFPGLGLTKRVEVFQNQDAVAPVYVAHLRLAIPAVGTSSIVGVELAAASIANRDLGAVLQTVGILIPALGTRDIPMFAQETRRHRAGGNYKRLKQKRAQHKRQDNRHPDALDRVADRD